MISLNRARQVAPWFLALTIVVLSVVPPDFRPVTGTPHVFEHLLIFLLTGFAFGSAYPHRTLSQMCGLVLFSGAIELIQLWIPGRHAREIDFATDAAAACIGIGLAFLLAQTRSASLKFVRRDR
jgi:VanZ family protein